MDIYLASFWLRPWCLDGDASWIYLPENMNLWNILIFIHSDTFSMVSFSCCRHANKRILIVCDKEYLKSNLNFYYCLRVTYGIFGGFFSPAKLAFKADHIIIFKADHIIIRILSDLKSIESGRFCWRSNLLSFLHDCMPKCCRNFMHGKMLNAKINVYLACKHTRATEEELREISCENQITLHDSVQPEFVEWLGELATHVYEWITNIKPFS